MSIEDSKNILLGAIDMNTEAQGLVDQAIGKARSTKEDVATLKGIASNLIEQANEALDAIDGSAEKFDNVSRELIGATEIIQLADPLIEGAQQTVNGTLTSNPRLAIQITDKWVEAQTNFLDADIDPRTDEDTANGKLWDAETSREEARAAFYRARNTYFRAIDDLTLAVTSLSEIGPHIDSAEAKAAVGKERMQEGTTKLEAYIEGLKG